MAWGILEISASKDFERLLEIGFGAVDARTLIRGWRIPSKGEASIIENVLVANAAQLVLSCIYFGYNSLFTGICLATEWSTLAIQRKGLRVSGVSVGAQRSTYFLQLPYRFAIPLMITAGGLHWLISQSIFLVNVEASKVYRSTRNMDYMTCGYSPIAMLIVIIIGVLMILVACGSGWMMLPSAMPVAGSCSAAISAACHSRYFEERDDIIEAALSEVQWGAIQMECDGVGHCCVTNHSITDLVVGELYAGARHRMDDE